MLICLVCLFLFNSLANAANPITVESIRFWGERSQGEARKRYQAWEKLIQSLKNESIEVQLEQVNFFFNQFTFETDIESRGVEDYWKTPTEFIEDGGGDCEDYAIIKYFTLILLNVSPEKLRITYVSSSKINQAHMVLSYYSSPEVEPLILDSLESEILPASKRPDLKPVYSFNASGLWLVRQNRPSKLIGQPEGLNKWDDLIKRMQE